MKQGFPGGELFKQKLPQAGRRTKCPEPQGLEDRVEQASLACAEEGGHTNADGSPFIYYDPHNKNLLGDGKREGRGRTRHC